MPKIKVLDDALINKIAAGEVIERPASVVKELVENSLDAGATKIVVEVKDSGKKLIRIADNGAGMSEDDARLAILRHATSKISSVDDLFAIETLGFRGEALASIAAVSQLSIITNLSDQLEGFNLMIEGGETVSSGVVGAEQGTTIEICNLFFNTPARKKFLKSDAVELRHIIDVVTQYALVNNNIDFTLIHENHELLRSPSIEDQRNNIASVYGAGLAKDLLEISSGNNGVLVYGYVGKPHRARNDKNQQALFVNGRWVRNRDVTKAVYDGFHSLLFVNKHPIFVLDIRLDPKKIDVNVHPQKSEIKIEQKDLVCNAVKDAIGKCLEENNLIPLLDIEVEEQLTFGTPVKKEVVKAGGSGTSAAPEAKPRSEEKYSFDPSAQTVFDVKESESGEDKVISPPKLEIKPEQEVAAETEGNIKIPAMKILGQIHKTFFIAETPGGMLLIDQHVVQERVLYEKFMGQLMNKHVAVQELLKGEIVEFLAAEKELVMENLERLKTFGFTLEHFGENSFVLKTIPTIFGRLQPKELIHEMVSSLLEGGNRLEEIQEEIITRMACRASVKAGDTMAIPEIQKLLDELSKCKLPYTCPHGRAVLIKISVDELEKKFRRK